MSDRYLIKFSTGPLAGRSYSLGPGEWLIFGSDPSCQAVIPQDPSVSAQHACIYYDPSGRVMFKDLGSQTGTRVNGELLTRPVILYVGDKVTIGQYSTFQSSWWNALQPSRMTRLTMSRVRPLRHMQEGGPSLITARSVLQLAFSILMGLSGFLLYSVWQDHQQEKHNEETRLAVQAEKNKEAASANNTHQSARFARFKSLASKNPSIKLTASQRFIWDEIVVISRRFGDPPPSAMDVGFIREVEHWIGKYTKRNYHKVLLDRKDQYWEVITSSLRKAQLPVELGYVTWVESNFSIEATSPVGAKGLWQFMPETGKEYGLRIDGQVDERLDPAKSSVAAGKYFTDLLKKFGSDRYLLALASYNSGQNRVKREQLVAAVRRFRKPDFWQMRRQLPQETADYVPKIIAAMIIGRNPDRWQQKPANFPVAH